MSTSSGRKAFNTETLKAIGERIRAARGERTQEEFAEAIGVSRSALTNYEAGRRLPNDLTLKKIADVSGTREPALLFGPTITPFELYRQRVNEAAMKAAQERPGYIPRFMISDDEYAFIALFRMMEIDGLYLPLIQAVVDYAKEQFELAKERGEPAIQWGQGHVERLEQAMAKGWIEQGFDPDFHFWLTFWEETDSRRG